MNDLLYVMVVVQCSRGQQSSGSMYAVGLAFKLLNMRLIEYTCCVGFRNIGEVIILAYGDTRLPNLAFIL